MTTYRVLHIPTGYFYDIELDVMSIGQILSDACYQHWIDHENACMGNCNNNCQFHNEHYKENKIQYLIEEIK